MKQEHFLALVQQFEINVQEAFFNCSAFSRHISQLNANIKSPRKGFFSFKATETSNLTGVDGREDGERDEEGEEDVEALREALLEHRPVGDGVHHALTLLLRQRLRVHVVVVAEETLQ